MRIIAGIARGAQLFVPRGTAIRPLTDLMRGAIFSRLGERAVGAEVLDLFSGTGAFGLEALSRGAARVTLVDRSREAIKAIEKNVASVKALERESVEIVCADVFDFVARAAVSERQFDIVFAGPPYAKLPGQISWAQKLLHLPRLPDILAADGWLIVEHFKKEIVECSPPWQLTRTLSHGGTRVEFLARTP